MRAVAVLIVLAYHLWPGRFPGGFIGVDVFFVISGFLITAHLYREASTTGAIRVVRFWSRRALRLLPLATTVLAVTAVAVALWAPPSTWRPALENIIASTLYLQNWSLAAGAVDYLARDQAPLPTQHFWSLSVEEQFYIVWPLLLIFALWIASRIPGRGQLGHHVASSIRPAWITAIAVVAGVSFAYSLWLTAADPGVAYFSTFTRVWQFAAGAALVFMPELLRLGPRPALRAGVAAIASWVGFLLVVAGTLFLPEGTPFPGFAALIPVVGAVLLLWAGTAPVRFTPSTLGDFRLVERIGDLSYGIYLWHWPIMVFAPAVLARPLNSVDKLVVIALAIALAEVSKRTIEDPFRYGSRWQSTSLRRFAPGITGMAVTTATAVAVAAVLGVGLFRGPSSLISPQVTPGLVLPSGTPLVAGELTPLIPDRGLDHLLMYDCFDFDQSGPYSCQYGTADSPTQLAIVGDSHGAHWIPGLVAVVESEGWGLTTFVGMNCDGLLTVACVGGDQIIADLSQGNFDVVLVSAFRGSSTPAEAVLASMTALAKSGITLAVISDVPSHSREAFVCLDENFRDASAAVDCTTPRSEALELIPDRTKEFALFEMLPVLDLTEQFCDAGVCHSILGSVVVYQDSPSSHLTTTASAALAPALTQLLKPLLQSAQ